MARVVMIPTARPTFRVDVARSLADAARTALVELGAEVSGPVDLVMTPEDVEAATAWIDPSADLVVNVCASFSDATPALRLYRDLDKPVLLWTFHEPGPVGDRLWLNSLCGANLFGHALVREGGAVRLLYGHPDQPEVRETLRASLRGELPQVEALPVRPGERADTEAVRAALASLRGQRIGLIGEAPAGFTPSEYDPALLDRLFGLTVEEFPVESFLDRVRDVDPAEAEQEVTRAEQAQPSLKTLDREQVTTSASITTTLQAWTGKSALAAVAVRCWPEFPTQLGACPCSSLSRVADLGTPTTCERDVYGAVTMLLLQSLGAGMSYLVDTVDLDEENDIVRFWHCGSAATALAADPSDAGQYVHCNRRLGVAGNFPLRTGPVIVARLTEDPDQPSGLRLLLTAGESLPEPNRFQGNTAAVRLDVPARQAVHNLVTGGFPHHTVLGFRDVRPQLRTAADLVGIPVVEW
ncbi:hypothetical protein ACNAW0_22145 [Micromonospora sp. SL1-18]|uniref:hypothetical protein n=1 Tax=Micromonospora sp. SL1-18 TaxID=3399128 RepID=UPI003A4D6C14